VISTMVGNMVDLIRSGENGFLVPRPHLKVFKKILNRQVKKMPKHRYINMSNNIRKDIEAGWSWSDRIDLLRQFFTGKK